MGNSSQQGEAGLIPGQGNNIPYAMQHGQKKKKKIEYNSFNSVSLEVSSFLGDLWELDALNSRIVLIQSPFKSCLNLHSDTAVGHKVQAVSMKAK